MHKNIIEKLKKFDIKKEIGCCIVSHIPNIGAQEFTTILLTEFNWGTNPKGITPDYLEQRIKIFDEYTFPSINAQTDTDFTWIIFLNDKTPQKYKDIIEQYKTKATMNLILAWTDAEKDYFKPAKVLNNYVNLSTRYTLTCRCDNDDMLAKNYIEEMKKNFRPVNNMYIDFIYGYCLKYSDKSLNQYKCRSCHFLGYVEDRNKRNIETVMNCDHSHVKSHGWVRRINNKKYPLWCEGIHETNIINTFRGRTVDAEELKKFQNIFF